MILILSQNCSSLQSFVALESDFYSRLLITFFFYCFPLNLCKLLACLRSSGKEIERNMYQNIFIIYLLSSFDIAVLLAQFEGRK